MNEKYCGLFLSFLLVICCISVVDAQNFTNIDGLFEYQTIQPGGTIFLGEEHLDVTNCLNRNAFVISIDNLGNVVSQIPIPTPGDFTFPIVSGANIWYQSVDGANPVLDAAGNPIVAFVSAVPHLGIRVWNGDTDTEVLGSVSRQQLIRFRYDLDTNLDAITTRAPNYRQGDPYINMALFTPDGEQLLNLVTLDTTRGIAGTSSLINIGPDPRALPPNDVPLGNWLWPDNILPSNSIGWWAGIRDNDAGVQGGFRYPLGEYKLVAVSNLNNMLYNNMQEGQTFDEVEFNLIETPLAVIANYNPLYKMRDTDFSVSIRGLPNHAYELFIYDDCPPKMTGKICDRPPFIVGDRAALVRQGIVLDPIGGNPTGTYPIGSTQVVDCCREDMTIREITPSGDQFPSQGDWEIFEDGTRYYARVTTGTSGTATVTFHVDTTIKAGEYKIQVQDAIAEQKGQTNVQIQEGVIDIKVKDARGEDKTSNPVFAVGDEIWIEGTNSDSNIAHMWITGPGLDPCGVNLDKVSEPIRIPSPDETIVDSQVIRNYWRLQPNWMTDNTAFGPGNYTIWVYSDEPDGRFCRCNAQGCEFCAIDNCFGMDCEHGLCELQNCPECIPSQKITITLEEPALEATVEDVVRCCCPGADCGLLGGTERFNLTGKSSGNYGKEIRIWLFAPGQIGNLNYLVNPEDIYCDNTFAIDMNQVVLHPNGVDLCDLKPGTYDLIVQAPGTNGIFDVRLGEILANRDRYVLTTIPTEDSRSFLIEGKNALFGEEAAKKLISTMDASGIDDLYVRTTFTLQDKPCDGNVDFTADHTMGNAPLTVKFTDNSRIINGIESSWTWFANDIPIGTGKTISHTFNEIGKYTIKMDAKDNAGKAYTLTKEWFINVLSSPKAKFSYTPDIGSEGEPVQFMDESIGNPTSWMWAFGDGSSSSLQSPTHVFAQPGRYIVTLDVGNANGVGESFSDEVQIGIPTPTPTPAPSVTADFSAVKVGPKTLQFTDLSVGAVNSWTWDFMDGVISHEQNPVHEFVYADKYYTVTLTVTTASGLTGIKQITFYVD